MVDEINSNLYLPSTEVKRGFSKEIWFIHGANASPKSFQYLKENLKIDPDFSDFSITDISYDCQENLASIVKVMASSASKDRQLFLVGHSLGGVLATAVAQRIQLFEMPISVRGVFTMASPFGGSESADYLRWLYPTYHLFRSISTQSRLIKDINAIGAVVPTLSLVTTAGNNPLFATANDGVVTVNSQRALKKAKYVEIDSNHFEVLLSRETIEHLKIFLKTK